MKLLRWSLYSVIALVVVAALGVAALFAIVDGAFVKTRLERQMKEDHHRTLTIEGTPQLRLFPVFRLALGKTTLSERDSDTRFVSLESAEVAVRVMPLLSGVVAVDALKVAGLTVDLVRRKDGSMNFADLAGRGERQGGAPGGAPGRAPAISIAGLTVERARIGYRDEASGRELVVGDLNLSTGRLDNDTPSEVTLSAKVTGRNPAVALQAKLATSARFNLLRQVVALSKLDVKVTGDAATLRGLDLAVSGDLSADVARQQYLARAFALRARGRLDRDALDIKLSAPNISITPDKATGASVDATLGIKGPGRNVAAKLAIAAVEGSASALSISSLAMELDATADRNSVKGRISTPVKANLAAGVVELPKIVAQLALSSPSIPQKSVTLPISGSARVDTGKKSAAVNLTTKFDESSIHARLGASRLAPLAATFDVAIDRLNLDRYLPKESKKGGGDDRIDLSGLRGPSASGTVKVGQLQVKRVKLADVQATIKLAGGRLEVAPHAAKLYGGTLAGHLSADANGNRIAVKETVLGVAIGPLLRDAAQKDIIEGRADVTLDVTSAGGTVTALKKALAGSARIAMKDGAVKGINLADSFRNVKSVLGSKSSKPDMTKKTDFSEVLASFAIKNGVAHNSDLSAKSPFVRLSGAGDIDIGNHRLDYLAKAALVASTRGQGGQDLSKLAGVTIPVHLTGALDKPDWNVDYSALIGAAGLGKVTEKVTGKVGGALRGLIGGKSGSDAQAAPQGGESGGSSGGGLGGKLRGLFKR